MGHVLSRREWLAGSACGFGGVALAALAAEPPPGDPLDCRPPHFEPRARRVIFLFMHGGVPHVDAFDPKPALAARNGQPLPFAKPRFEFAPTGNLLASPWRFHRHGQCGMEISELFPEIGSCADRICLVRSMNGGDQVSHGPALLTLNTGSGVFARPSLGAWTLYGLVLTASGLYGGTQAVTATYSGDGTYAGSSSSPVVLKVRDSARPTVSGPRLSRGPNATLKASFKARDGGGVKSILVKYRTSTRPGKNQLGKWSVSSALAGGKTSWASPSFAAGIKACVAVQARDFAGKASKWRTACAKVR